MGMSVEAAIAERIGLATGLAEPLREAIQRAGLPVSRPASIAADDILAATRPDKKARRGKSEYALPARIGAMAGAENGWKLAPTGSGCCGPWKSWRGWGRRSPGRCSGPWPRVPPRPG